MTDIDNAIKKIDRWLSQTKTSESRLGLLSAANAGAIQRIRNGTAQIATLQAVLRYIEANPPGRR
jgi:ABC-type phosphate/phosphonate transport system substrate-binding protein